MAVPETSPPVPVVHNSMQMLAQTLVPGDGIHRAVTGHFRHAHTDDIALAKGSWLNLASANEDGTLTTHLQQPVHATVLDLQVLRAPHREGQDPVSRRPAARLDMTQPLFHSGGACSLIKACTILTTPSTRIQAPDRLVLLTTSCNLSVLHFDAALLRYAQHGNTNEPAQSFPSPA